MRENDMWKSVNFALTMAFMGDIMRESESGREKDVELFGIKTELKARTNSLIASRSGEESSEQLEKAEELSGMLVLSVLCMLVKRLKNGEAEGGEMFAYLDESLGFGMGKNAMKALEYDLEEIREGIKKSMKSLILMGLKSENMTDVLHLFKALARLSRFAEEKLVEMEGFEEPQIGTTAAELGELALDAAEMAKAETEKDGIKL